MTLDLTTRAGALERVFFAHIDAGLVAELRRRSAERDLGDARYAAAGIPAGPLATALEAAAVDPMTLLVVSLVPLLHVAWADGAIQRRERDAILAGAAEHGIQPGGPRHQLLASWLSHRPDTELLRTWGAYVSALDEHLYAKQRKALMAAIVDEARRVARAAGGFLGLHRICEREDVALRELEAAFKFPEQFAALFDP